MVKCGIPTRYARSRNLWLLSLRYESRQSIDRRFYLYNICYCQLMEASFPTFATTELIINCRTVRLILKNSNRGFFFAHIGWWLLKKDSKVIENGKNYFTITYGKTRS
jgi:hypothetical protein